MTSSVSAPFSTSSNYVLASQPHNENAGEIWQKVSESGKPLGKVVGYSALQLPPNVDKTSSTVNWSDINLSSSESRFLKFNVTLTDAMQELELTDKNEYGAEENVQSFHLPSIRSLSSADQEILAKHGNNILLEFKQDKMGHWLLKLDSKCEQANDVDKSKPVVVAKSGWLARTISELTDATSFGVKLTQAKETPYQYVSPYATPAADPRFLIPANFSQLSKKELEDIYKSAVSFYTEAALRIVSEPGDIPDWRQGEVQDAYDQLGKLNFITRV